MLVGGAGTGIQLHYDIWNTHAWIALLSGRKRGVMHPPASWTEDVAIEKQREANAIIKSGKEFGNWEFFELSPGDVVKIPSSYWHSVLNVEASIAITRNFTTQEIIPRVRENLTVCGHTKLLPWLTTLGKGLS